MIPWKRMTFWDKQKRAAEDCRLISHATEKGMDDGTDYGNGY
ncbi:hypothetical protein [Robinsoniella peoriensis]